MSVAHLTETLNSRIAELAQSLLGKPNLRMSNEQQLRFRTKGSIAVEIAGEKAGQWYDHEAEVGGAGLQLIGHVYGLDRRAAYEWARGWLKEATSTTDTISSSTEPKTPTLRGHPEKVDQILRRAVPTVSTPVLSCLRSRGITVDPPDCIRYRRSAFNMFGALVALATDAAGEVLAVQQIYLTADGRKAPLGVAKRTNKAVDGWARRAAVRLPGRAPLVLCEGVETALSVWQATRQEVRACLGISNIGHAPVSDRSTVIIARDGDAPGSKADQQIVRAANRLGLRGITVMIATPPQGQDFNDLLAREGEEAVRSRISSAELFQADQPDTGCKRLDIGSDGEIARRIRSDLTERHGSVVYAKGSFWRFGGTHWEPILEDEMRVLVHRYDGARFGEQSRVKLTQTRINSVIKECGAMCATPGYVNDPPVGINCASGFIRFDENGRARLEPHHRDHRCRHTLPGNWKPGASSTPPEGSLLFRLLTGIFKGDPDADAKRSLLAEVCGAAALGCATKLMQEDG